MTTPPTQNPVQLLRDALKKIMEEATGVEAMKAPARALGSVLFMANEALAATKSAEWCYGHIDTAPKEEQLIAILRGCDTGAIRYAIIEWSQYGWLFDGSEISNAWDIIGWKVLDLPTRPTKSEG